MEGFDNHTDSQCAFHPVSCIESASRVLVNEATRGAVYYVLILCNFALSIPATMHQEVSRTVILRTDLKLIYHRRSCLSH